MFFLYLTFCTKLFNTEKVKMVSSLGVGGGSQP